MTYTYNGNSNVFLGGTTTLVDVPGTFVRASGNSNAVLGAPVNARGLVHNQINELESRMGGTHTGHVLSDPGTTLRLVGAHDFQPTSTLTADHLILARAISGSYIRGTVDIAGFLECIGHDWSFTDEATIIDYSPTVTVIAGDLTFEAPTDRSVNFDNITIGPSPPGEPVSSATFDSGQPFNVSTLGFYSGEIRGNSPINISEKFIWRNGNFFAGGDISADGTIEIRDTNSNRSTQRSLIIAGNATMLAGLVLGVSSRLDIVSTGVFELIGDTSITGLGVINNAGLLLKSTADEHTTITADINNTATVELRIGQTHLQQMDYVQTAGQTILSGGGITSHLFGGLQIDGGTLTGIGTADCDVDIDGGTAAPGLSTGELIIGGDYAQTTNGTLEIEISGIAPGGFDVLTVVGTATLEGDIEVVLINGFVPIVGSTFEVLTASAVIGTFDNVTPTGLPAGLGIEAIYTTDSVTLEITGPNPADCDDDGDIDLVDYACFFNCISGPGGGVQSGCEPFDFDFDADVDIEDFNQFQTSFTG